MKHPGYTEEQERALGQAVINMLDLKFTKEYPDRVNTVHGTKTVLGLGRMILREIENIEEKSFA